MNTQERERKIAVLSEETRAEIEHWLTKYPADRRQSALLAALRAAQHQNHGYLTTELMDAVAAYLGIPEIAVYEVATFYSMFETQPVGRHSISVCTNISCWLMGSDRIVEHIERRLGIKTGESTPDGKFFLKCEEECLAACDGGPMMQIDHVYYERLTPEKVDAILDAVAQQDDGH
ncbi:MAG: NADH-quinone oxidoreductase subunit NuoE [Gammaproteobacteria bacterium]|nr:NADH-quinone oxidoreductase subunit NuoE [Gammaproteobacteria bacterium]